MAIVAGLILVIAPELVIIPKTSKSVPDPETTVNETPGDTEIAAPLSTVVRFTVTLLAMRRLPSCHL